MSILKIKLFICISINMFFDFTFAMTYLLNTDVCNRLIGKNLEYIIPEHNIHSLEFFAEKFQVGLRNVLEINPNVDLYLPSSKKVLIIPQQLILPNTPRTGIIINSAETRLFYYPKSSNTVIVFPISIGTVNHETPSCWSTTVKNKKKDPIWIPTHNMRNEYIKKGKILPKILLPGPNNPMGSYALYVGNNYAIHGTKKNFEGIGLRVTRGCIRLRPKDIESLYTLVPIGTKVEFINEPIKTTADANGNQYIEIHFPLFKKNTNQCRFYSIKNELKKNVYKILEGVPNINYKKVNEAIDNCSGIPINITN